MSDDIDPEVAADYTLRARSVRTRAGLSDAQFTAAIRETATPNIVGQVPCRARCGNVVDWTADAQDRFEQFNRMLEARNEAPLDKTKIAFCRDCIAKYVELRGHKRREQVDALADVIRKIKKSSNPDNERALIAQARAMHHPDVEGLLEALRTKNAAKGSGKRAQGREVLA